MTFAIATDGLTFSHGRDFLLDGAQMHVPTGSVYGFLGPNGAGKTTTIRLLLGLQRARSGRITVLGREMPRGYVDVLRRVGYVPERPHLYPSLTVQETLDFHAAFHDTWDSSAAIDLLRRFELTAGRPVGSLSKGETGKLMMLVALAQRPELLVLDEPTDGLDPVVRRDVLQALLEYVSSRNATVLISSHLVHELERFCDWISVMDRGRLVAEMPMQRFKDGIKRLRVTGAPHTLVDAPFVILHRHSMNGAGEQWLVRDWMPGMEQYLEGSGATLPEVVDLDLEEGFVELLKSFRAAAH